mmetsp:Transcript_23048/g.54633  ORF Transcript_23048/g.54633 Transcript_23048/m.54633 type:complete len:343 (+) Transcript_23048:1291-2319(+)
MARREQLSLAQQVPPQLVLELLPPRRRNGREQRVDGIAVLLVRFDLVREDVSLAHERHVEAREKVVEASLGVGVGHRAPLSRLRVVSYHLIHLSKVPLVGVVEDPEELEADLGVHHQLQYCLLVHVLSDLSDDLLGVGAMMDHAEGPDQIELLDWDDGRELFSVDDVEGRAVRQAHHLESLLAILHALGRELCDGDVRARLGEARGCRAYASADLEHPLSLPTIELRPHWNVVLHQVLSLGDLIPVFLGSLLNPVKVPPRIAGSRIPVISNLVNRNLLEADDILLLGKPIFLSEQMRVVIWLRRICLGSQMLCPVHADIHIGSDGQDNTEKRGLHRRTGPCR